MADNIDITEGSGKTIATDDIQVDGTHAQGQVQFIKLVDGTLNGTGSIAADIGAKANALRVAPASDITDATYIGDIKFGEAEPNSAAILADTTAILADTAAIQTAVELLDNAVDGNYLNVNVNAAGVDLSMNAGVLTAQTQRVTIATDDEVNNLLGTIDADTSVIAGDTTSIDGKITACNTGAVVLAAGVASIGTLGANSGVDIGDVDVTSVIPGTGATNLGKAEDAGHTSGDVGVMSLAVRFDAGGALAGTDLDYSPLQVDANGALRVTGGGGGTEYTEDVATANPIVGSAIVMERDDVIAGLTPIEGDWAAMRCSAEGALWVQDFNSDAALALLGTIDADTSTIAGDTTSIDGKITACNTGAVVLSSGTVTTVSTVTNLAQLGGVAVTMGEGVLDAGVQRVSLATDDDGVTHLATIAGDTTSIDGKITACNTGAVTISAALPAGDNNIGNVDIASSVALDVSAATVTVDLGANNDVVAAGDVAHDAADSGNPIKIGFKAYNHDGTVPGTAVAELDRANGICDVYGRQYVSTDHPYFFNSGTKTYGAAQTNTTVQAAPGAGLSLYITDIVISNGATAGIITLLDGSGGTEKAGGYFAANGGMVCNLKTPIKLTANTLLAITSTTVTTHKVTVNGYIAP